jgi:hypothetical protein
VVFVSVARRGVSSNLNFSRSASAQEQLLFAATPLPHHYFFDTESMLFQ